MCLPCAFRRRKLLPELHFSMSVRLLLFMFFSQSHWHTCSLIFPMVVGQPSLQPPVDKLGEPKIHSKALSASLLLPWGFLKTLLGPSPIPALTFSHPPSRLIEL